MKCDSLAFRTESREEYQRNRFCNQIVKEPPPIQPTLLLDANFSSFSLAENSPRDLQITAHK